MQYGDRYGEGHLVLACHAAFPSVLSTDLVYKIWQNFRFYRDAKGRPCQIHSDAVADVLLSGICMETGYDRYKMHEEIRHALLDMLQAKSWNGQTFTIWAYLCEETGVFFTRLC